MQAIPTRTTSTRTTDPRRSRLTGAASLVLGLLALAGCGGGDDPAPAAGRGALLQNPPTLKAALATSGLQAALGASAEGQALLLLAQAPRCGIDVRYLQYNTVGAKAEATTATGALMLPTGSDPACSGARPILLYAHGTNTSQSYNLANITDPNNAAAGEAILIAAMYAAQGFIVVAPNYAGYDQSSLGYHPYLVADQQSKDMIDALTAARTALGPLGGVSDNGKLFITGYSQGGHVALATHRAMQTAGMNVTASVGQSGPYALSMQVDATFGGQPNLGGTLFTPLLATSWQQAYGDIYTSPTDLYNTNYATGIDTLLPSRTLSRNELVSTGKLPLLALFDNDVANHPQVTDPFKLFYGAPGTGLVKTSYANTMLADLVGQPCPHDSASAPLNCAPTNTLRKAARTNDLRNWKPVAPVLLCGGKNDPSVFLVNAELTRAYFLAAGATSVDLVDVDSAATGTDSAVVAAAKVGFAAAQQQVAAQARAAAAAAGGDVTAQDAAAAQAVLENYHGTLVPPFCSFVARDFFLSK